MTFRQRIVASVAFVTAVTIGMANAAVSLAFNFFQGVHFDEALVRVAEEEARTVGAETPNMSDRLTEPEATIVRSLSKFAALYAEDGQVVASTNTFKGSPPPLAMVKRKDRAPFDFRHAESHLRGVFQRLPGDRGRYLLVAIPRDDLDEDEAFLQRAMVVAALLSIAWVSLVTYWTLGRLTKDHRAIADVARRVADGDLSARIGPRPTDPEVAQLARDLDQMIAQLEHLVSSQRRFIAHAAHELRSPLTAVSVELQHALRSARDVPSFRAAVAEALDSATRLISLANNLLLLARVQNRRPEVSETCALEEVIDAVLETVRAQAAERRVTVETGKISGHVPGSRSDLESLLRNLVENAIRHAPTGTSVQITTAQDRDTIEIEVSDSGPGVPREDRERIFEPFYRSGASRSSTEGAGLGLGIAREIARAHGGDVVLVDVERGCVFRVVLPSVPPSKEPKEPASADEPAEAHA